MRKKLNTLTAFYVALLTSIAMLLFMVPMAFAGSITVSNNNDATITTVVSASTNTGGNTSTGDSAGDGGDGGHSSNSGSGRSSAGDAGRGGHGGDGGTIRTGEAIATAIVTTDVNTTDVEIEDSRSTDGQYNEYMSERIRMGSESDASFSNYENREEASSEFYDEDDWSSDEYSNNESDSSANRDSDVNGEDEDASVSTQRSASDSENWGHEESAHGMSSGSDYTLNKNESSDGSVSYDEWDNYDLMYAHEYVDAEDDIEVANNNSASVGIVAAVAADSGFNLSDGDSGGAGGDGGNAANSGGGTTVGGNGRVGGNGGTGGDIHTGRTDSLVDVVTVSGRTTTRIVRN